MINLDSLQKAGRLNLANPNNITESLFFIGQTSVLLTLSVVGFLVLLLIKAKNKKEIEHISCLSGLFLCSCISALSSLAITYIGIMTSLFITTLFLILALLCMLQGLNIRSGKYRKLPKLPIIILSMLIALSSTFNLHEDTNLRVGVLFLLLSAILFPSILSVPKESDNPSKKEINTQILIGLSTLVSITVALVSITSLISLSINAITLLTAIAFTPLYFVVFYLIIHDLSEAVHIKSITDITTGSFNRRYMNNELRQIMKNEQNNVTPLHFMIISIDSFKSLNREFGFKATDEILSEFSFSISSAVNEKSSVIYIGGDEFLIALINVERKDINNIVEDIRLGVEQIRISYTKENLGISIQCGLATYDSSESMESLITRAELDLKKAN
jgi:diguanylate cyclase (GGDEF)-like protein